MKFRLIFILFFVFLSNSICNCQIFAIDSCGLDTNPILNKNEVIFLDSIMFAPYKTKRSGIIDRKHGFDFNNKKLLFFSCTIQSNTGNGLITKKVFFTLVKPDLQGHAGNGIIIFNAEQRIESKGYDAAIIVDCPYNVKIEEKILSLMSK